MLALASCNTASELHSAFEPGAEIVGAIAPVIFVVDDGTTDASGLQERAQQLGMSLTEALVGSQASPLSAASWFDDHQMELRYRFASDQSPEPFVVHWPLSEGGQPQPPSADQVMAKIAELSDQLRPSQVNPPVHFLIVGPGFLDFGFDPGHRVAFVDAPTSAGCSGPADSCAHFRGQVLHGLGHVIGLEHNATQAISIMQPPGAADYGDYESMTLASRDKSRLADYRDEDYRFYRKLPAEVGTPCDSGAAVDECAADGLVCACASPAASPDDTECVAPGSELPCAGEPGAPCSTGAECCLPGQSCDLMCACEVRGGDFKTCVPVADAHACNRQDLRDPGGQFIEGATCRYDDQCDSGQCGCPGEDPWNRQCLPGGHPSDCAYFVRCDDTSDCEPQWQCGCNGGYERQCLSPAPYADLTCVFGEASRPAGGCRSGSLAQSAPWWLGQFYTHDGDCVQRNRTTSTQDQMCSWYRCEAGSDAWMTRIGGANGDVSQETLDQACGALFTANASGCPAPY